MNKNNKTDKKMPLQKECILVNRFGSIEAQIVDVSIMGLGVKTDKTLPFKSGSGLDVFISGMPKFPQAKLMWTKKDSNNTTRLGLNFSTSVID